MSTMMQQHHPSAERGPAVPGIAFFSTTHPPQLLNMPHRNLRLYLARHRKRKNSSSLGIDPDDIGVEIESKREQRP